MPETRAIDLRVRLPDRVADEVERVRDVDPTLLNRIVAYGVTRRAIFDHLVARGDWQEGGRERSY